MKWREKVGKTEIKSLYAPHCTDGKYFRPWMKMRDRNFLEVLAWKLFYKTSFTKLNDKAFCHGLICGVIKLVSTIDALPLL